MTKTLVAVAAVATLTLSACSGGSDNNAEGGFYAGKTIELIAPVSPGGSVDGVARLFARKLSEHLEGNPTVQVVNIDGGGGILAGNEFANKYRPDGETLMLMTQVSVLPEILGMDAVKYNLADMTTLWAANRGQAVMMANTGTGITDITQLAQTPGKLTMGTISPAGADLPSVVSLEVLGLLNDKVDVISGYENGDAVRNAFMSGELDIHFDRSSGYVKEFQGRYPAIYTYGETDGQGNVTRDQVVPDAPDVGEAYQTLFGTQPSGEAWDAYVMLLNILGRGGYSLQTHKEAPADAVEALDAAVAGVVADAEFTEQLQTFMGPFPNEIIGEDARQWGESASNVDPESLTWVQNFLATNFDMKFN
ncbi:MAG: hypothetical protein WBB07_20580 [Mycobacterium sp.]